MKIVVIGLGSMGKRRMRLLKKMRQGLQLVGVDQSEGRAHGVDGSQAFRAIRSWNRL